MINIIGTQARQKTIAESIRLQLTFENLLARRITPLVDRQARTAAKVYKETGDSSAAEISILIYDKRWNKLIINHLKRVGLVFGNKIFEGLKKSSSDENNKEQKQLLELKDEQTVFVENLNTWVARQGLEQVKKIQQTTQDILKLAILEGQKEGEGQDKIAKRIVDKISGVGRVTAQQRARTIARTETHNAATFSSDEAAKSTGLELEREWLAAEDIRTRPDHSSADGQRRKMDESFDVGGSKLKRPGDPNAPAKQVINCRCVVIYHTVL